LLSLKLPGAGVAGRRKVRTDYPFEKVLQRFYLKDYKHIRLRLGVHKASARE